MLLHLISMEKPLQVLIRWLHFRLHTVYFQQTIYCLVNYQFLDLLSSHQTHFTNCAANNENHEYNKLSMASLSNSNCFRKPQRPRLGHRKRPRLNICSTPNFFEKNCLSYYLPVQYPKPAQFILAPVDNTWNPTDISQVPRPVGREYGFYGLNFVDRNGLSSNIRLLKLSVWQPHNKSSSVQLRPLKCVHELEMEDPLHRYGSYLKPYFAHWLSLPSPRLPFFEWLDSADGRCVQLSKSGKCVVPRSQLDLNRVIYCSSRARRRLQVVVDRCTGRLLWRSSRRPVSANDGRRWIFVIDKYANMYVHPKQKARFHHSSFVSGQPVLAAGRLQSTNGHLTAVSAHSGHYQTPLPRLLAALTLLFGDACLPVITNDGGSGER